MKKTNSRPPHGDNISQNIDNIDKSSTFDNVRTGLKVCLHQISMYVHMYICQSQ
jgi:hypothetical protein